MSADAEAERAEARRAFAACAGLADADWEALASDASPRRYFRLRRPAAPSVLLMDAPPEEDLAAYVQVAGALRAAGLSAPAVLAEDRAKGFLLIQDFGDATYTRLLARAEADPDPDPDPETERRLYALAVDALVRLHKSEEAARLDRPRYDADLLVEEAALLADWALPVLLDRPCGTAAAAEWRALWRSLLDRAPATPDALVLRDFHVDNLMRLEGEPGVRACGLLDFQDAVIGPRAYDVISLLEDARRDLSEGLRQELLARYRAGMGAAMEPAEGFERWAALLAAQRHAKVIGIFARLARRDGKPAYLRHIPRVVGLLRRRLAAHGFLAPVSDWIAAHAPDLPALADAPPPSQPPSQPASPGPTQEPAVQE